MYESGTVDETTLTDRGRGRTGDAPGVLEELFRAHGHADMGAEPALATLNAV